MGADYKPSNQWIQQDPISFAQAAPVLNTWYVVLPATGRYTKIQVIVIGVGVANETLEIEITIDGFIYPSAALAAVAGNGYNIVGPNVLGQLHGRLITEPPLNMTGHDVQIRMRKTTALGAGDLLAAIRYELV